MPKEIEELLRVLLVAEEALWLDTEGELSPCEVNHEVVAPDFIPGDAAKLVFFSAHNYVTIGGKSIKLYQSKKSAWLSACFDAAYELGFLNRIDSATKKIVTQVINKATELINSLKWWAI